MVLNEILFQRPNTFSRLLNSSIYILYAVIFNCLIRWVMVIYMLVIISVANSHATPAYEYELLMVTWYVYRAYAYDLTTLDR